MRALILTLLLSTFSYGQDLSIVHFNYKWNTHNQYDNLEKLKGVRVKYAYVEEQSDALQASIKASPTLILFKDNRPVARFEADLTMRIQETLEEIQEIIDRHKESKRKST
jgi:alkaline phosphatase